MQRQRIPQVDSVVPRSCGFKAACHTYSKSRGHDREKGGDVWGCVCVHFRQTASSFPQSSSTFRSCPALLTLISSSTHTQSNTHTHRLIISASTKCIYACLDKQSLCFSSTHSQAHKKIKHTFSSVFIRMIVPSVYTECIDLYVFVHVHVFGICAQPEMREDELRSQVDEKPSAINQCPALIFLVMSSQNVDTHKCVETYTCGTRILRYAHHKHSTLQENIHKMQVCKMYLEVPNI